MPDDPTPTQRSQLPAQLPKLGPWGNLILFLLLQTANALIMLNVFPPDPVSGKLSTAALVCSVVVMVVGGLASALKGMDAAAATKAVKDSAGP